MSDIVEFLTARLDEDEQAAHRATGSVWAVRHDCEDDVDPYWGDLPAPSEYWVGGRPPSSPRTAVTSHPEGGHPSGSVSKSDAEHIARHDPARVLAEVAAKRAIIAEFRRLTHPEVGGFEGYLTGEARGHWRALRALASVYADHPDFDLSWRGQ